MIMIMIMIIIFIICCVLCCVVLMKMALTFQCIIIGQEFLQHLREIGFPPLSPDALTNWGRSRDKKAMEVVDNFVVVVVVY